jgi:hypothetical protein
MMFMIASRLKVARHARGKPACVLCALLAWTSAAHLCFAAPAARVEAATYDFGSISDGVPVRHVFKVGNAGDAPLTLKAASVCCGAKAVLPPGPIPPGGSGDVSVEMNLRGRRGAVNKSIYLSTNDPANPHLRLALTGNVLAGLVALPGQLTLTDCLADVATGAVVRLTSDIGAPFSVMHVWSSVPWLRAVAQVGADGASEVRIDTVGLVPEERTTAIVRVAVDASPEPLAIPVTVSRWEPVTVAPRCVILGQAGSEAPPVSRFVALSPRDAAGFKVLSAKLEGVAGSVDTGAVAGGRWRLHLRDLVLPSATSTGAVVVTTTHPLRPSLRIPVWAAGRP